jgi:predicted nucleic acid-binding protein
MQFIDTNVFLRFLTRDDFAKAERVKALLEQAEQGEVELTTSESIICELVFVLSSPKLYNVGRERMRQLLLPIVSLRGLRLANRAVFVRALDLYAVTSMDFIDALAVAHMEARQVTEVYSCDRHFDGVNGVRRLEP